LHRSLPGLLTASGNAQHASRKYQPAATLLI
jgi:hypothetical protein